MWSNWHILETVFNRAYCMRNAHWEPPCMLEVGQSSKYILWTIRFKIEINLKVLKYGYCCWPCTVIDWHISWSLWKVMKLFKCKICMKEIRSLNEPWQVDIEAIYFINESLNYDAMFNNCFWQTLIQKLLLICSKEALHRLSIVCKANMFNQK